MFPQRDRIRHGGAFTAHARADYFVLRQVSSLPRAERPSRKAGSEALRMRRTAEGAEVSKSPGSLLGEIPITGNSSH